MKKLVTVSLIVVMLMCLLCGCGGATNQVTSSSNGTTASSGNAGEISAAQAANEITVGIPNDLDSLDPYLMAAAGTREVMLNVYEGLVKPNSAGEYVCAVAEKYEVSDDGLVYTFTIRDGVKFHNGQTVTPEDVLYSFEKCAATTFNSAVATALSVIESVDAKDNAVVVTLSAPNSDFIACVSAVYIIPAGYEDCATQPVGTGPFKFISRSVQESAVIERNDDYYGTKALLNRVNYRVYEDNNARITALNAGTIDVFNHLTIDEINTLTNGYNVLADNMNLVAALYLNNKVAPFDNEQVRKALNYAINVDDVIAIGTGGYGTKVGTSMYPNFTKYYEPELADAYAYDPDMAKQLLREAGYENGFSFSITVPSNYAHPYGDIAQVLIEQLAQVGITASIEWVDWSTWLSDTYQARNFETTITGFTANILTASALLQRFTSDSSTNMINYNNPEYDKTFAAAQACVDDAEQTALYKQCLQMLSDTAANVYLMDLGEFVVINPALDGYTFYPMYMQDVSTIHYVG